MARLSFIKSAVITASAVLVLSSCGDKEEPNKDNPRDWLLESISVLGHNALSDNVYQLRYEYEYDSQNRIAKCIIYQLESVDVWRMDSEHTLDYNADGDLERYDVYGYYGAPHTNFTTNGNKITFYRSHKITQQISITENGELELNDHGLPVRLTSKSEQHHSSSGTSTSFYTFILTWLNGNLGSM